MAEELVTGVMITGKSLERRRLAIAAVRSFCEQTWANKELVIVNTGESLQLPEDMPVKTCRRIKEVFASPALLLGPLRELGLDEAKGDWIIQFDDDDWSHRERIAYQMSKRQGDAAVLLRSQIRYSFPSRAAFVLHWPYKSVPGIPGTILHPRRYGLHYRIESKAEDEHFIQDNFGNHVVVAENGGNWPHLYLRFYHGTNTWNEQHIMHRTPVDRWFVSGEAAAYLDQVLNSHYADLVRQYACLPA